MKSVRFGIIGFGHIGAQHAKEIISGKVSRLTITAVADTDPERRKAARDMLGESVKLFDSAQALIHSGEVDGVVIAVPHYLHPSLAEEAIRAGVHVLVEKPAGVYTRQVKRMNETAAAHPDVVFCMDFNQRTNPLYQKVKDLLQSGELGEMKRVIWIITDWYRSQSYYDQGGWRATWDGEGGGVLLNQNPHNLDLWQWICGMPCRVRSQVYYGKHRKIEVEDDLYAVVEYPNGATGAYITTVGDAPGTNRLEIDGERGQIVVENNSIVFKRLRIPEPEFNRTWKKGLGKPEVWNCEVPVKGKYTSHAGILSNFADCILDGAKPIAPGAEGLNGLEISNAIHLSSWTGGDWTNVPVDDELFMEKLQEHCKHPLTI